MKTAQRFGPIVIPVSILTFGVAWVAGFVKSLTRIDALPWCLPIDFAVGGVIVVLGLLGWLLVERGARKAEDARLTEGSKRTLGLRMRDVGSWLLLVTPSALVIFVVLALPAQRPPVTWTFWLIVSGLVLLWLIVTEFGRYTLRVAAAIFLVGSLVLMVSIGRDQGAPTLLSPEGARDLVTAVDTSLAAFVQGVERPFPATYTVAKVQDSVLLACRRSGGALQAPKPGAKETCEQDATVDPRDAGEMATAIAEAKLGVARQVRRQARDLSVAATSMGGDAAERAKKHEARARAGVAAAKAELAAAPSTADPPPPDVPIVDALEHGAEQVVAFLPGVSDGPANVTVAVVGWVILALLALVYYRALEIRAVKFGVGPVSVVAGKSLKKDEKTDDPLVATFETHLLQNVSEPGAVPESSAGVTVTDLIGTVGDPSKFVGKFVEALLNILRPTASYNVIVDRLIDEPAATGDTKSASAAAVVPAKEAPPAGEKTTVVVRIVDARNRAPLWNTRISGNSAPSALRAAAYSAAGWVIARSDEVPPWAEWNAAAADALAANTEIADAIQSDDTDSLVSPDAKGSANTKRLEEAFRSAPRSALIAVKAGNAKSLEGKYGDALDYYARSSALYARYIAGRYRTAVGLSLVANDPEEHWWSLPPSQRAAILYSLKGAQKCARLSTDATPDALAFRTGDGEWMEMACAVSESHLLDLEGRLRLTRVITSSLRRNERSFWVGHFWRAGNRRRKRLRGTIETARLTVERRRTPLSAIDENEVERQARRYTNNANALYNLACWRLVTDPIDARARREAIELLERARDAPGGGLLKRGWLRKDPDLKPIENEPRFERFLDTIAP